MARVTTVTKSLKALTCGRCGVELPKGSSYRWAKPGFRSRTRLIRCIELSCSFRQSELTTSKLSEVYAAQEDALEELDAMKVSRDEELLTLLQDCAGRVQEVAQEYADAADEMGAAGEEMQERADELESWAEELEGTEVDEPPTPDEFESDKEFEENLQAWWDEQVDRIRSALDEMPV